MGLMVKGVWHAEEPGPGTDGEGRFLRARSTIRHWITPDGPFTPEPGRYHLYVAINCPWAHRALLARVILGLEDAIGVSYARVRRTEEGWVFDDVGPHADPCLHVRALHEVYARQRPPYTGRVTVPVLWDRKTGQIVSNESADIVRMFGSFGRGPDLTPPGLAPEIEAWNALIYRTVNNGVYRAGFARSQGAYDEAVTALFDTLDRIEAHLESHDWLVGERFTEADLRLFPTLARFDVAYHYAFKCNIRRLVDYPRLWAYARRIYHMPGVAGTVDFEAYKQGYFSPSPLRNPLGIVPKGPLIDWSL
ncbi:MAG: glutathione-dependent reductase [Alphaproteobacteria bacterium]|nr:MAG: glutathione-dependent reductase [Alphaproteobacteria bacterium]